MKKKLTKEEKRELRKQRSDHRKMVLDKLRNKNKKEKPEKAYVPPGYKARKAGIAVMFGLVAAPTIFVASSLGNNHSDATEVKKPIVEMKENPATSQAATQFAKDFTEKYFFWKTGDEGRQMREKDMTYFLADGLDPYAGLNMDDLHSNSIFKDAKIKNVEKVSGNKSKITLLATYEVTTEGKAEGDKKPPAPQKKTSQKVIVVPVQYTGSTYAVYELPTFTSLKQKPNLKYDDKTDLERLADADTVQNISNFLNTFFSSYAQDSKDKLSYILEDKEHQYGLQNTLKFVEVEESEVYEGKSKNQYIVDCLVNFEDPDSQSKIQTRYNLTVEKKDSRFIVIKIN